MGATPLDVLIAGVNKAGTTSLFVSLSEHPRITPSAVKETRFFLPARYGEPVAPVDDYEQYFESDRGPRVRLEATPSYFYGGAAVASVIDETLPGARIIVVLREPVARTISFFQYQKTRLRIPARADDRGLPRARRHAHGPGLPRPRERAVLRGRRKPVRGLPPRLGSRCSVPTGCSSSASRTSPGIRRACCARRSTWLGLDPDAPPERRARRRRTGRWGSRAAGSSGSRSRPTIASNGSCAGTRVRSAGCAPSYFRLNGQSAGNRVSDDVRADLAERFREPNQRLAGQLRSAGFSLPSWLEESVARRRGRGRCATDRASASPDAARAG